MINNSSIIVSSRIRIARNFAGRLFHSRMNEREGLELIQNVANVLSRLGKYKVYSMRSLDVLDAELMWEKHLISREILSNQECGGAIIRSDEAVSVLVNEEDHIRVQCILRGLALDEAYSTINDIDDEISSQIEYAFSPQFGYLTSCVTNLGNGLRASVMMFLPALTLTNQIDNIVSALKEKGLTVRGELGEGSAPLGYLYQVSNSISMGITERETISAVVTAVKRISDLERDERRKFVKDLSIKDLCLRAYGILTNCSLLSWREFMMYSGQVKLAISLDFLRLKDSEIFDKLSDCCSDAGLSKLANKKMTEHETMVYRAEYVKKILLSQRLK